MERFVAYTDGPGSSQEEETAQALLVDDLRVGGSFQLVVQTTQVLFTGQVFSSNLPTIGIFLLLNTLHVTLYFYPLVSTCNSVEYLRNKL